MQNVSNLQIPEGVVRTIHDKNNRLLWGRVAYDTKYAGDTYQQTYSGKNLVPFTTQSTTIKAVTAYCQYGSLYLNGTANGTVGSNDVKWKNNFSFTLPAGTYTLSGDTSRARTIRKASDNSAIISVAIGEPSGTFTLNEETEVYFGLYISNGASFTDYKFDAQLESGSPATSYEPYTGGIPAPSPSYPTPINVVTGTQTITITDGTNTQNFIVDLGSAELCKIGDYQDYIYPSNGDWFVRKDIDKVTIDGSYGGYNGTFNWYYCTAAQYGGESPSSSAACVGNLFRYIPFVTFKPNTSLIGMSVENGGFRLRNTACSSASDYQTWLSNNNLILYYQLATATDIQITDATLVGQLNAVHEWLTRYGYNSTVTGNLPIIIDRTNL